MGTMEFTAPLLGFALLSLHCANAERPLLPGWKKHTLTKFDANRLRVKSEWTENYETKIGAPCYKKKKEIVFVRPSAKAPTNCWGCKNPAKLDEPQALDFGAPGILNLCETCSTKNLPLAPNGRCRFC